MTRSAEHQFTDAQLDSLLLAVDPADPHLSGEQTVRKTELLASLTDSEPLHGSVVRPMPRRRMLRWTVPIAAAAALAGVFVLHDGTPGGGGQAYASWTPRPVGVGGQMLATAQQACLDDLRKTLTQSGQGVPEDQRPITDPEQMHTVVAERRGNFLFLVMASSDGSTQQCFSSADRPSQVDGAGGGLATRASKRPVTLTGHQLEALDGGRYGGPDGTFATSQGRVGPQVRAVTVKVEGRAVRATLTKGNFAAWWPDRPDATVSAVVAYDLTLADGSTIRNAPNLARFQPDVSIGPRQIGAISRGGGVSENGGEVQTLSGRIGSQVSSVTVHTGGQTIRAEVNGRGFSAQWPSRAAGEQPAVTFDLGFTDGSVAKGVTPVG